MGGHGVFVSGGGGMSQPRGMHQPGMHSMNPSQGLRAQVPHPFLSAQVCFLLLLIMMKLFVQGLVWFFWYIGYLIQMQSNGSSRSANLTHLVVSQVF